MPASMPAQSPETPRLTEESGDPWGGKYETQWMCEPPELTVSFRVVREEWNADYTVRTIHEIRLIP